MPAESLRHAVNCIVHLCREVKPSFLAITAVPSWWPIQHWPAAYFVSWNRIKLSNRPEIELNDASDLFHLSPGSVPMGFLLLMGW